MSAGKLGVANTAQGGFINIGADTRQVQKRFEGLMRAVKDEQKQLAIHRKVAKVVKVTMRAEVKDSPVVVKVRRSEGRDGGKIGPPLDIQPGTLRRSVIAWKIRGETSMWVGPRKTGKNDRKDGWFAGIVEGGDQRFGAGPNKGAFLRSRQKANGPALKLLEAEYVKVILKVAQ